MTSLPPEPVRDREDVLRHIRHPCGGEECLVRSGGTGAAARITAA
jgi:hypothetical protein